ncbi:hypothetical protein ABK040_001314 [Willaertia magna]
MEPNLSPKRLLSKVTNRVGDKQVNRSISAIPSRISKRGDDSPQRVTESYEAPSFTHSKDRDVIMEERKISTPSFRFSKAKRFKEENKSEILANPASYNININASSTSISSPAFSFGEKYERKQKVDRVTSPGPIYEIKEPTYMRKSVPTTFGTSHRTFLEEGDSAFSPSPAEYNPEKPSTIPSFSFGSGLREEDKLYFNNELSCKGKYSPAPVVYTPNYSLTQTSPPSYSFGNGHEVIISPSNMKQNLHTSTPGPGQYSYDKLHSSPQFTMAGKDKEIDGSLSPKARRARYNPVIEFENLGRYSPGPKYDSRINQFPHHSPKKKSSNFTNPLNLKPKHEKKESSSPNKFYLGYSLSRCQKEAPSPGPKYRPSDDFLSTNQSVPGFYLLSKPKESSSPKKLDFLYPKLEGLSQSKRVTAPKIVKPQNSSMKEVKTSVGPKDFQVDFLSKMKRSTATSFGGLD